jgi:pyruvate formate lyase activating enzyme
MNINPPLKGFPGRHWHKTSDGYIECDVCPNHCKLQEGQRGLCFIRARDNNQIVLTTYGLSSGLAIDPVEKKPLYHFLPNSYAFSFGTVGCNFACEFCQNWQISKAREMQILAYHMSPTEIAQAAKQQGCQSVAFTYNEPTIFLEYAVDTAKECHKLGLKTIAVTNGYICEAAREEFYSHMDAANVDLKGFSAEFYKKIIHGQLQPILDTLYYIKHNTKVWLEITTLLIPGENDSIEELDKAAKWLVENLGVDVPIHYSAFHPAYKMLKKPVTPLRTLQMARDTALKNGIRYAYTGNVYDNSGSSTYCHNCKNCIIERDGYRVTALKLTNGNCNFCGAKCAGIFNNYADS